MDCDCEICRALEYVPWWVRLCQGSIVFTMACLITWLCW